MMYLTQHDVRKRVMRKYRVDAEESSSGKAYDVVKIHIKGEKYKEIGQITLFGSMDESIEIPGVINE